MNLDMLRPTFRGELLTPASPGYETARVIWNAMIDRRPAVIAQCTGPADVAAVVRFARDNGIYPAIRAGGHNVAGLASVDGGLIIDLTRMKGITVDPAARTAIAQTGLTWGEFDRETQLHGLAAPGGIISTTGIAGLTLGGGVGWLLGRFGLSCDNTLAYEVITADGTWMKATANENTDLFWALKGGGGNFGVVTSITYRLHPVKTVLSGMVLYPFTAARDVLRNFRDFCLAGLPDELTVYAGAVCTPDGIPAVAVLPTYSGDDLEEGKRVLAPLRAFGTPIADLVGPMPYLSLQQMLDGAVPYPVRSYWKANYMNVLPDDAIDTFVEHAAKRVSPRTLALLEHAHGAPGRVAVDATAFALRHELFDMVVVSMWDDPGEDTRNIEWTRNFHSAMQPWSSRTVYVNGLDQDDAARIPEAYGSNYARLCEIKAKYDPENRFRRNHNIRPQTQTAAPAT